MNQSPYTLQDLKLFLVKTLKNGALEASFKKAFCEYYYEKVFAIAMSFSKNIPNAKDITQDVFLKSVFKRSLNEFQLILFGKPDQWIYVIVKHQFFDFRKSKERRTMAQLENINDPKASDFNFIDQLKEIGLLSFSNSVIKIILLLRAFGYTYKEIALELNITEGQAKMMVKRWRSLQN